MGGVRPGRVFAGWLVLVGLYTALTNSDRLSQALGISNSAIVALSSPDRPLIRDHGAGAGSGSGSAPAPATPITVPNSPWIGPPINNPFAPKGISPWIGPPPAPNPFTH